MYVSSVCVSVRVHARARRGLWAVVAWWRWGERGWLRERGEEGGGWATYLFYYGKKWAGLSRLSLQPILPRSLPPHLQSNTTPLPPFKAAGLQTVKVQSDSDHGALHGALRLDYTKLRPHKTN